MFGKGNSHLRLIRFEVKQVSPFGMYQQGRIDNTVTGIIRPMIRVRGRRKDTTVFSDFLPRTVQVISDQHAYLLVFRMRRLFVIIVRNVE